MQLDAKSARAVVPFVGFRRYFAFCALPELSRFLRGGRCSPERDSELACLGVGFGCLYAAFDGHRISSANGAENEGEKISF